MLQVYSVQPRHNTTKLSSNLIFFMNASTLVIEFWCFCNFKILVILLQWLSPLKNKHFLPESLQTKNTQASDPLFIKFLRPAMLPLPPNIIFFHQAPNVVKLSRSIHHLVQEFQFLTLSFSHKDQTLCPCQISSINSVCLFSTLTSSPNVVPHALVFLYLFISIPPTNSNQYVDRNN